MEEQRLAKKETKVEQKRRTVEDREREADDVIAFAHAVADGRLTEAGKETPKAASPSVATEGLSPARKTTTGFARARKAFSRAFARLRHKERKMAHAEAEARVASDLAEIKRADEVIVAIASQLPAGLRKGIAEVRGTLTARIMGLDRLDRGRSPGRHGDQESK